MKSATTKELRSLLDLLFDDLGNLGVNLSPQAIKELHSAAHALSDDDLRLFNNARSVSKACDQEMKKSSFCVAFRTAVQHVAHGRRRTMLKKAVAVTLAGFALLASHRMAFFSGIKHTREKYHAVILPLVQKMFTEKGENFKLRPEIFSDKKLGGWDDHMAGVAFEDKSDPGFVHVVHEGLLNRPQQ